MSAVDTQFWVIIPAAGCGSRMKSDIPKQYLPLIGKRVIEYSLDLFLNDPDIEGVVVVADSNDPYIEEVIQSYSKRVVRVDGGLERVDSVLNGLKWLYESKIGDETMVLVHDAARPCLSSDDLQALKKSHQMFPQGAILTAPVVDTLKQVSDSVIVKTYNRNAFRRALTPQMAPLKTLKNALENAKQNGIDVTDESQALELVHVSVGIIEGNRNNFKITYPEDLAMAEFVLKQREQNL